ncbi:superinfection immunity protein [Pleomorphomonas koreensis]|uniref:superinfection immunity protein n=1 Tax=Pleomorphomonas koreensis TaxID=257440 RepID=UPI00056D6B66
MGLVLILIGLAVYFIPTFVAGHRQHHNLAAIFMLNLLLGWTFLGWALSLVWALTAVNQAGSRPISSDYDSAVGPVSLAPRAMNRTPPAAPTRQRKKSPLETNYRWKSDD